MLNNTRDNLLLLLFAVLFGFCVYMGLQIITDETATGGVMLLGGGTPATTTVSGCGNFEICSEFANLTGWTQDTGTWAASGTLTKTAGDDHTIRYSATQLANAYRQYCKVKIANYDAGSGSYPYFGILLRSSGATGYSYATYFYAAAGGVGIFSWNNATYAGVCEDGLTVSPVNATNVWVGFEVYNTGVNTTFNAWSWASDPGDKGDWGAADDTSSCDTDFNDTGLYAGIVAAIDAGSVNHALDSWYCGSSGT